MRELAKKISKILQRENCKFVLIGAFARDLYFEQKNIKLPVSTKDVDFAVLTESWEEFDKMKGKIINELGLKQDHRVYRLLLGEIPIDLLPFGNIEDGNSTVKWPGTFRERMKVMGFKEAYENGVDIDVDGEKIRTIIPEMLVALKLSSWSHGNRVKDAIDIKFILENIEVLCKDLITDETLKVDVIENELKSTREINIARLGIRINKLLEGSDLKDYLRNVLENGYNKDLLIRNMNNDTLATGETLKMLKAFVESLAAGILNK